MYLTSNVFVYVMWFYTVRGALLYFFSAKKVVLDALSLDNFIDKPIKAMQNVNSINGKIGSPSAVQMINTYRTYQHRIRVLQ